MQEIMETINTSQDSVVGIVSSWNYELTLEYEILQQYLRLQMPSCDKIA